MPEDLGTKPEEFMGKEKQLADELKQITVNIERENARDKEELRAVKSLKSAASDFPEGSAERAALEMSAKIMESKAIEKYPLLKDEVDKYIRVDGNREINTLQAERDYLRTKKLTSNRR